MNQMPHLLLLEQWVKSLNNYENLSLHFVGSFIMLILCLILKMLNIENNLILEYNYIDEGIIMKIIIYLESKEKLIYQLKDSYSLDLYKNLTKEALYYGEKEDKFIASDGGIVTDSTLSLSCFISSSFFLKLSYLSWEISPIS